MDYRYGIFMGDDKTPLFSIFLSKRICTIIDDKGKERVSYVIGTTNDSQFHLKLIKVQETEDTCPRCKGMTYKEEDAAKGCHCHRCCGTGLYPPKYDPEYCDPSCDGRNTKICGKEPRKDDWKSIENVATVVSEQLGIKLEYWQLNMLKIVATEKKPLKVIKKDG